MFGDGQRDMVLASVKLHSGNPDKGYSSHSILRFIGFQLEY
jgi:hypothetical protein